MGWWERFWLTEGRSSYRLESRKLMLGIGITMSEQPCHL